MGLMALGGCDAPPIDTVETGFRGTGMVHVADRGELREKVAETAEQLPDLPPPTTGNTPQPYENVQVLGDLSLQEFTRTMQALTAWVSPEEGCNYCHVVDEQGVANFASDDIYTKRVSRWMLRMVKDLNTNWESHVGEGGVTCNACHQGQPQPDDVWYFTDEAQIYRHYLDRMDARVQAQAALDVNADPEQNRVSVKQTEYTYALMIDMSESLGVNCTYCHNSPRWGSWEESTPQRVTALRGIRMAREINNDWILPITNDLPDSILGPMGDAPKVGCVTCHQGAYKPFYGAGNASAWPALEGPAVVLPPPSDTASADGESGEAAPAASEGVAAASDDPLP
jgi:photosynthetic reaction center cytochrome c subunit